MKWNIGTRPEREGEYWAVLIAERCAGQKAATIETRYFGIPFDRGWVMDNEPEDGLAWHIECGSLEGERVYAWAPLEESPFPELPDDVVPFYDLSDDAE